MFRYNLRRNNPSSWPALIQFLKRANLHTDGDSIVPLLVPMPLPRSWRMWRLDATEFERKLTEELQSGESAV
jgi:hypothetical protein